MIAERLKTESNVTPMPQTVELSPREYAIAQYIPTCLTIREIAAQEFVNEQTIKNQLSQIYIKSGIYGNSRQQLTVLILTGRIRFTCEKDPAARHRLNFTAFADLSRDPQSEKQRLLRAFEEFLEARL